MLVTGATLVVAPVTGGRNGFGSTRGRPQGSPLRLAVLEEHLADRRDVALSAQMLLQPELFAAGTVCSRNCLRGPRDNARGRREEHLRAAIAEQLLGIKPTPRYLGPIYSTPVRCANATALPSPSGHSPPTHRSISRPAACRTASAVGRAAVRSRLSPRTDWRARSFPPQSMKQFCCEPLDFSGGQARHEMRRS
jgi:hypothetical protein